MPNVRKTKVKRIPPSNNLTTSRTRPVEHSARFANILKARNPKPYCPPEIIHDNWFPFCLHELIYCPAEGGSDARVGRLETATRTKSDNAERITLEDFKKKIVDASTSAKQRLEQGWQRVSKRLKSESKNTGYQIKMKDIILALVARVMFGAHGLIAIWRAYSEYNKITMWLLLVPVGLLILEGLFTVGARGGEEYKWISPCVLLYLASVVPSVWFLELKNFDRRQVRHICNDLHWGLAGQPGCLDEFKYASLPADVDVVLRNITLRKAACEEEFLGLNSVQKNESIVEITTTKEPETTAGEVVGAGLDNVVGTLDQGKKALDNLMQNINFFNEQTWILVLHQLLLFFLIVGRWLLPTGEGISRDQLSQLLLVFIGVGADILEFVTETAKEIEVRCDRLLLIVIMGFWSWSTLQFSLVLTASKARRTRAVGIYDGDEDTGSPVVVVEDDEPSRCTQFCKNMEVWGILSTLVLQDGPFLATRLYIMVGRGVVHQMIVFFTTKNALVVILQLYRLSIIAFHKNKEEDDDSEEYGVSALGTLQSTVISGINPKQLEESATENGGKIKENHAADVHESPKVMISTIDGHMANDSANNSNGVHRSVAFVAKR